MPDDLTEVEYLDGGRTRLTRGSCLADEIASARRRPASLAGAVALATWLQQVPDRYLPGGFRGLSSDHTQQDPEAIPEVESEVSIRFRGWQPERPAGGRYCPPVPFDYQLPVVQNDCPVECLNPWWQALVLKEEMDPSASTWIYGQRLGFGPYVPGEGFDMDPGTDGAKQAVIRVYPDRLEAQAWRQFSERRIEESGTALGLISPTLASMKDLTATASTQYTDMSFGCRLDLELISSIRLMCRWSTERPLLAKNLKRLVDERGYGEFVEFNLSLTVSDGWRPYQIMLAHHIPGQSRENEPIEFATWLAKFIAHHRMGAAASPAPEGLAETLDGAVDFSEFNRGSYFYRAWYFDLPGHQPLAVERSDRSMLPISS